MMRQNQHKVVQRHRNTVLQHKVEKLILPHIVEKVIKVSSESPKNDLIANQHETYNYTHLLTLKVHGLL